MRQRTPTKELPQYAAGAISASDPPGSKNNINSINPIKKNRVVRRRKKLSKYSDVTASVIPLIGCLLILAGFTLLEYSFSSTASTSTLRLSSSSSWLLFSHPINIDDNDGPPKDLIVHGSRDYYTPVPPESRKKAWVVSTSSTHVIRAFRSQGWFVTDEKNDFFSGRHHILYTHLLKKAPIPKGGGKRYSFKVGKPWQRYSRIPGGSTFADKDKFYVGFRNLQRKYDEQHAIDSTKYPKKDLMYFIPESYKLDEIDEQKAFQTTIETDKMNGRYRPWVLKKVHLNNGAGIEMIPPDSPALYSAVERSIDDEDNNYIVQSYICNELTWFGGKKFDLRFYWLVASIDPLIVLYHDGYARVAGAVYNESDWKSTGQHLTNHAFRVDLEKPVDEDVLPSAIWRRVREHYEENQSRLSKLLPPDQQDPVKHVRNQIKEAISTTVEAFKANLDLNGPMNTTVTTENLFSFLGADFVIDSDLDVYYLEAQTSPGNGDSYDYRVELFRSLYRPMVNIVEEIAIKQQTDPKANLLPIESLDGYEIVYAGDNWRYQYHGYERSKDKKGCQLSPSAATMTMDQENEDPHQVESDSE